MTLLVKRAQGRTRPNLFPTTVLDENALADKPLKAFDPCYMSSEIKTIAFIYKLRSGF
jgi:hypothetical protein